jgi:hypothetical protein
MIGDEAGGARDFTSESRRNRNLGNGKLEEKGKVGGRNRSRSVCSDTTVSGPGVGSRTAAGEEGEEGAHGAQMGKDKYAEARRHRMKLGFIRLGPPSHPLPSFYIERTGQAKVWNYLTI